MKKILVILMCTFAVHVQAQEGVAINNDGASPDASSILDLKSTTKGILIPRMTEFQRTQISNVATGLLVFQTDGTSGFYFYSGSGWESLSTGSSGWNRSGNVGTTNGTDFIGTTDAQDLDIRTNNVVRARITQKGQIETLNTGNSVFIGEGAGANDDLSNNNNVFIGKDAGASNTTGFSNTAYGFQALNSNTTGSTNTANGYRALRYNTWGFNNTANGSYALYSNTTGDHKTANGSYALRSNTTGYQNTANGNRALYSNTTGYSNVAMGERALYYNTDRSNLVAIGDSALYNNGLGATSTWNAIANTAVGSKALFSNTTGNSNTATGNFALYSNTTGYHNTANGYRALSSNTLGYHNTANGHHALYTNTTGFRNTANGYRALYSNTSGNHNTANGYGALYTNTAGSRNTANGSYALYSNTTGDNNTANGNYALNSNTTGHNNTALGYDADVASGNLTNATAIGYNAEVDASNKIQLGNTSVTSVATSGALTTGAVTYPNTDGISGHVLTTNGAGVVSFQPSASAPQDLSLMGNTLWLTNDATTVNLSQYMDNTDIQDLTLTGNTLSLTNDFTPVNLSSFLDNTDNQDLTLTGTILSLTGDISLVNLSSFLDNTDHQDLTLTGNTLSLTNDATTVDLSAYQGNTLDEAYDEGGAGAGRTIDATDGAVRVNGDDGFIVTGTYGSGDAVEVTGAGTRMFFNPNKGAFRAGRVTGTEWDNANIGVHSTAMGQGTTASGDYSTAMGQGTTAPSGYETVIGRDNTTYVPGSTTDWNTADRLFVVGNGTGAGALESNALTIYKDGKMNINDAYDMPTADGTPGQVMTTNGSGVLSFQLPSDNQDLSLSGNTLSLTNDATTVDLSGYMDNTDDWTNSGNNIYYNNGSVGIGTSSPNSKLHVNNPSSAAGAHFRVQDASSTKFCVANNGYTALYFNDTPSYNLQLNVNSAAKPTSSSWTVSSDARLKTNVSPFSDGLNVLMAINPVWFQYNGKAGMPTNERGVGTIAQELQKIAPYMVNEWTFTEGSLDESTARPTGPRVTTNYLGVDYGPMDFIVINSIQEQQSIIESQKAEIDELKAQMIEMQAAIKTLTNKK